MSSLTSSSPKRLAVIHDLYSEARTVSFSNPLIATELTPRYPSILRDMGEPSIHEGSIQDHALVSLIPACGPVAVGSHYRSVHRALSNAGIKLHEDLSSPELPGASTGYYDIIEDREYHRHSTDRAFLPSALAQERKSRLKICTDTIVTKIELSADDDGPRASAVHFEAANTRKAGQRFFARARREIVLCAGALGSPHLLMLRYRLLLPLR